MTLSREIERMERKLSAAMGARPRNTEVAIAALEEAVALTRRDSGAARWFSLPDLLCELADEYEVAGRVEDALTSTREAIAAGLATQPDGRCRLAEILMRAGRADEAAPIWAEVKADTPNDVWLYNVAGIEYARAGDHATALTWLSDGLRVAVAADDPEQLVAQLRDFRAEALVALGREPDELQSVAEAYVARAARTPTASLPHHRQAPPAGPLPGRNDVCWCGSGRKYKKCCGAPADQER
jgi:tetratricopeptide (TPR) repeat protein